MSKVVKSAGRSIGSIVKGAAKVLSPIYGLSQSKTGRKILKVAAIAATVYFGGAALMGAVGGASAGTGVAGTLSGALSGAQAGISSAWSGLTGAFSAGSLSGAASSLGSGFSGAYGAGASAVQGASAAAGAAGAAGAGAGGAGGAGAFTGQTMTGLPTVAADAANVALNQPTGLIGKMMASPYAAPALINTGGQLIGGVMQGVGAQQQVKERRKLEADALARYKTNVGADMGWA